MYRFCSVCTREVGDYSDRLLGDGFDLEEGRGKGGLGLVSMEERVRLVNGTFSIQSRPGEGTRVEVRVPLQPGRP
jgi:signal transduction histidine kinase